MVCKTVDVTQNVRAFEVVSDHREFAIKIDPIHEGNLHVCGREGQESREHFIQGLHDFPANVPRLVLLQNGGFTVAGAEQTYVRQPDKIRPHRQAANVTFVRTTGARMTNENLFVSDLVRGHVNHLARPKRAATNGAMIGIRPRRRGETNQNRQTESQKPSPLTPHKTLSDVPPDGLSLN